MRFATSVNGRKLDKVYILPTPKTYDAALDAFRGIVVETAEAGKINRVIGGVPRFAKDKLTFWHTNKASEAISKICKAPVSIFNDAELGALGEAHFGAGQKAKIMGYLTFSTGFGGARIVKGQIDQNYFGFEPKLQIADVDGNSYPSISLHATGRGLRNKYGKPAEQLTKQAVWRSAEHWMGVAINNAAVFWSPEIIVVGGAVAENKKISFSRLNAFLNKRFKSMPHHPRVVKSELGQLSGLYGALSLVHK